MKRFRGCLLSVVLLSAAGVVVAQDAESKPETKSEGGAASPASLFEKLDANSDGKLVKDEVPEEQRRFFERLVRLGDGNDNGELTREEFEKATSEQTQPGGQPGFGQPGFGQPGQGRNPAAVNPAEFFKRIDRNSDGKLSRDELPDFMRERVGRMLDDAGKDSLTLEEFMQLRQRMEGAVGNRSGANGRPVANPEETFKRLDTNNDGKLLLSEIPEQARRFFGPLFERLGKGPDAGISQDEFAQAARQFGRRDGQPRPEGTGRPGEPRPEGNRPPGDGRPMPGGPGPDGQRRGPRFFGLLDGNRDGRLSRDEVAQMVGKFGELDQNGDGQLDLPELFGAPPQGRDGRPMNGRPEMDGRPFDGRPGEGRPQNRRPESDRPGDRPRRPESDTPRPADGEPRRNASRENAPRGGFDLEAIFRRLDRNNDDAISRDEAIGRLKENFDRADSNGDGRITQEELRAARPRR